MRVIRVQVKYFWPGAPVESSQNILCPTWVKVQQVEQVAAIDHQTAHLEPDVPVDQLVIL